MNKGLFVTLRRLGIYAVLLLSLAVWSCLKNEDDTVVLPPYMEEIPEHVIPHSVIDTLKGYMTINEGPDPPVIEGGFLASPMALVHASDDYVNNNFYDARLLFSSQSCRNMVCYYEEQYTAQLSCDAAVVTGRAGFFTFAGRATMSNPSAGWSCTLGLVISGKMQLDGTITGLEYANAMLEKTDPYDVLIEVGDYRVYRDQDGLSTVEDWQPSTPVAPTAFNIMKARAEQ